MSLALDQAKLLPGDRVALLHDPHFLGHVVADVRTDDRLVYVRYDAAPQEIMPARRDNLIRMGYVLFAGLE